MELTSLTTDCGALDMTRDDIDGLLSAGSAPEAVEQALDPARGLVAKPPLGRGPDVDGQARRAQRPTDCGRKNDAVPLARVANQIRARLLRERVREREVGAAVERLG